ncbi:MAG: D-alanine--D-alanine ligase, partial [Cyanobacteria bacterium P01_H01_bin.119]
MTLQVLHLVGGTTDFYAKLSRMYAQSCLEATSDPARYRFCLAYISPDRRWRFPASLEPSDIESAPAYSQAEALAMLAQQKIDVALPQMFCIPGMTEYRALLEAQQIPYIGNRPEVMATTATKAQAKAAVAAAGLAVPAGQILQQGDRPTLAPPVIVKPNDA